MAVDAQPFGGLEPVGAPVRSSVQRKAIRSAMATQSRGSLKIAPISSQGARLGQQ